MIKKLHNDHINIDYRCSEKTDDSNALLARQPSKYLSYNIKLSYIRMCRWIEGTLSRISNAPFHASAYMRSLFYNFTTIREKSRKWMAKYLRGICYDERKRCAERSDASNRRNFSSKQCLASWNQIKNDPMQRVTIRI